MRITLALTLCLAMACGDDDDIMVDVGNVPDAETDVLDAGSDLQIDTAADMATDAFSCDDEGSECDAGPCARGLISCVSGLPECVVQGPSPNNVECRPSTSDCDAAEFCDGDSLDCPIDLAVSDGSTCAGGICTAGECGACVDGTPCDTGEGCEIGELTCDGVPTCTPVGLATEGTVCRVAASACDAIEYCTGSDAACPADGVAPTQTVCRPAVGGCDAVENCDGESADCPADEYMTDVICREGNGSCDWSEACDGTSPRCPEDSFQPLGEACTIVGAGPGECNGLGVCGPEGCGEPCSTGNGCEIGVLECGATGARCVATLAPAGHVCRPAAGGCDVEEVCDGTSVDCPDDKLARPFTMCRASAGLCDSIEYCSGRTAECPTDRYRPQGYICRLAAGRCDIQDGCNGARPDCPDIQWNRSANHICRRKDPANACDAFEFCDAQTSLECPADGNLPDGSMCVTDFGSPGMCTAAGMCAATP